MTTNAPFKKAFVFHPECLGAYVEYEIRGDFVVAVSCRDVTGIIVVSINPEIACTISGWQGRKDMFLLAGCRVMEVTK